LSFCPPFARFRVAETVISLAVCAGFHALKANKNPAQSAKYHFPEIALSF